MCGKEVGGLGERGISGGRRRVILEDRRIFKFRENIGKMAHWSFFGWMKRFEGRVAAFGTNLSRVCGHSLARGKHVSY